jgi:hypothetical protein
MMGSTVMAKAPECFHWWSPSIFLVAVHSGCFLRRQFDYFIDRNKGAIAQRFLEKARLAGNIEVIDYGEARPVSGATYRPTPSTYCSKVVDFSTINGSHAHAARAGYSELDHVL